MLFFDILIDSNTVTGSFIGDFQILMFIVNSNQKIKKRLYYIDI